MHNTRENISERRELIFIRHAESEANAGARTESPHLITLSPRGVQQSIKFAEEFDRQPDLIIVTLDIRTQQTAEHLIARFPRVPVEVWPLHEFTFLSPGKFRNTTAEERKAAVENYWGRCDPNFVDGPGAESFYQFALRITENLDRIRSLPHRCTLVFSHGHVMRFVGQVVGQNFDPSMIFFRNNSLKETVPNLNMKVYDPESGSELPNEP